MGISVKHYVGDQTIAINETKALDPTGQYSNSVGVLRQSEDLTYLPLGGVIDSEQAKKHRRIKIVNICEFFWDELAQSTPYSIPNGHITVGAFIDDKCYIAIADDKPVHYSPAKTKAAS
ncbi:hypothetical protein ABXZ88_003242 [Vibrio fluvialis]